MPSASRIVVIGSINMDLVCRTPHIPKAGETILGSDLKTVPGGKGANQAIAAAKLGGNVAMVGRVGDDDFGQRLLNTLQSHRVDSEFVTVTEGIASGCALIEVDRKGENSIVVAPGANYRLTPKDLDRAEKLIASAAVVVLQLEIPLPTVRHALAMCRRHSVYSILDPAPAPAASLPRALFDVDLLSPNQSEAEILLNLERTHHVSKKRLPDPKQIAGDLLERGSRAVMLKLGGKGSLWLDREGTIRRIKPFKVKVVDTTAAGDAFTAGLAVARAEGLPVEQMGRFANAAGAVCCQSFGAVPALPTRGQVQALMDKQR